MKILLTGATGYIGRRLLPVLVDKGHQVVCLVRDSRSLKLSPYLQKSLQAVVSEFLEPAMLNTLTDAFSAGSLG